MKRVAVIGLGNIATRHRRNLKALFPDSALYAMSASGRVPNEVVSDCDCLVANVAELIEAEVELVIVASPATSHAKHALPCIEAGIPTLIEKPVAASRADSALLVRAIEEYKTPVAIGYCLRYLPSARVVKTLLENNHVGTLYNADINVGQYLPDWRPNKNYRESVSAIKELGGGALLELSHELDYAQWLLGDFTVEHAVLRSSDELALSVEDIADIFLRSSDDVVTTIHLDFLQRHVQRRCSFMGSKGRLDWNLVDNSVVFFGADGCDVIYAEPDWDKNQMYVLMLKDFMTMIENKPHQCVELAAGEKTVDLIERIREISKAS